MDEKLRRLLQEDMEKEADKLMEEVNQDPSLANIKAPDDIYEKLTAQIREYEANKTKELSKEDQELIRLGKIYKKRRKRTKYFVLAAAMVLAFALSVTSIGGPKRVFEEVKRWMGDRVQTKYNTESDRMEAIHGVSESEAYEKIEEEYSFCPVKLTYLPKDMKYAEMIIGDEIQNIQLLYEINNKVGLYYYIQTNNRVSSIGTEIEEEMLDEEFIRQNNVDITLKKYKVEESNEKRWQVDFEYRGNRYSIQIFGLNKGEVKKIIENLYFS